jgi:hypothetical protein
MFVLEWIISALPAGWSFKMARHRLGEADIARLTKGTQEGAPPVLLLIKSNFR